MAGRSGTLSPISIDSNDTWSPVSRYQNLNGSDNPYSPTMPPGRSPLVTPPASVHTSASTTTTDGSLPSGPSRRTTSNGNPSPPSSIARSSDGTGLYASSVSEKMSSRKALMLEETLSEHYTFLSRYLAPYLRDEKGNPRPGRAQEKLTRLSPVQFQELSTDVYDESLRREEDRRKGGPGAPGNDTPKYLLPKQNFHPKRNQARQKLATLALDRFRQLAKDVFFELERRFPRFAGGEMTRSASPATSIASSVRSGRTGTPNSMGGRPPPGYRGPPGPGPRGPPGPYGPQNGMPGPMGPGGPRRPSKGTNELGRPIPKTYQSNTIVPNKSTMVEDDDESEEEDDQEDAFGLEGAAKARQSRRTTNKSLRSVGGPLQDKMISDLQSQVSSLQEKVTGLEGQLRDKDGELERLKAAEKDKENASGKEKAEWSDLRNSLEQKLEEAQNLNDSLRSELSKVRSNNEETERSLRAEIDEARRGGGSDDEWRSRYEDLERDYGEQQQITDEVRHEAAQFLQEMRSLSEQSGNALEMEERLQTQVSHLEGEIKEWKSRYARAKTQLRTLKASSMGLAMQNGDISHYTREFMQPDGLVKDVHVTKFQLSIDELLQTARRPGDSQGLLDCMKGVVICIRQITADLDSVSSSNHTSANSDGSMTPKQQGKLKARVSATANNLITASKNHAAAAGLSPVSLLDAAASHLSTAVVELVKCVKIRPTPEDELERDDFEESRNGVRASAFGMTNGYGHGRHQSHSSVNSLGYSISSSPQRPDYSKMNGHAVRSNDAGLEGFKNYLEDQTAVLVNSIQPMVQSIRSRPPNAEMTAQDEAEIGNYIEDIGLTVQDIAFKTNDAIHKLHNAALAKHAPPVIHTLEDCRGSLLEIGEEGRLEGIPPVAFKIARATKELVLRVERVENGELTSDMMLPTEF